ncbi:hypothetical protein [Bradyrhizobium sp. NAS96.2]|uniref:DUF7220 family protein n=1 Tax=Bradyrhizobium sp. NAS96.2 TaxID=1680160 RepID=UPI00093CE415|nr:hypothetical protein [Bradyrhizobium sp. NAS96.2]OKO67475.1 hypothetical protein AC628_39005 [Bradyrhizobium sp. NAS96.2]
MKQTKLASFAESAINVLVGFGISLAAQVYFLPLLGVTVSIAQNITFALIMIVISICRSYLLRRLFEALHIRRPLSPFMQAVIAERFRQVEREGWSTEHDDGYDRGTLGRAGAAFILHAGTESPAVPHEWPWTREWWKPAGYRRDLVRGVALAIAEGERFDRNRNPTGVPARLRRPLAAQEQRQ